MLFAQVFSCEKKSPERNTGGIQGKKEGPSDNNSTGLLSLSRAGAKKRGSEPVKSDSRKTTGLPFLRAALEIRDASPWSIKSMEEEKSTSATWTRTSKMYNARRTIRPENNVRSFCQGEQV